MLSVLLFCLLHTHVQSMGRTQWTFYMDARRPRMVAVATDARQKAVGCHAIGSQNFIDESMKNHREAQVITVGNRHMNDLVNWCHNTSLQGHFPIGPRPPYASQRLDLFLGADSDNSGYIFPGTRWCGPGDIATSYDDLGFFKATDSCCRTHDHCPDWIDGNTTKYGLYNFSPWVKSRCDCDHGLFQCLHKADTFVSNLVGRMFFDITQPWCFEHGHPEVGCKEWTSLLHIKRCKEYIIDMTAPEVWQFLDNPYYDDDMS